MRYTQDGANIKGPGLPKQGAVAAGPAELDAAFNAGVAFIETIARRQQTAAARDFHSTGRECYKHILETAEYIADFCRDEIKSAA